jgi:hypothetical protein
MKQKHKHSELIKQWADGAEIEMQGCTGQWFIDYTPYWGEDNEYRIKPEPKPDIVEWHNVASAGCIPKYVPNIKLTFDGETGKLKSAEVI